MPFTEKDLEEVGFANILLMGPAKSGKCLVAGTKVPLADGRLLPIERIVEERLEGYPLGLSLGLSEMGSLVPVAPSRLHKLEPEKCLEVRTRTGRIIRATFDEPYLTPKGWENAHKLKPGSEIAIPIRIPFFGAAVPEPWMPKLLGYLIGDGRLAPGNGNRNVTWSKANERIADDCARLVQMAGDRLVLAQKKGGSVDWRIKGAHVRNWLRDLGLLGHLSRDKFVPEAVFTWSKESISAFLFALLTCDGWLRLDRRTRGQPCYELGYSTASDRLIEDVQHLLLRFGVHGRRRRVKGMLNGVSHPAWSLEIDRRPTIRRFLIQIGIDRPTVADALVWAQKGGREWKEESPELPDVRFDTIAEVVPIGEHPVFDLTIPNGHNFVANDVVVHNTCTTLLTAPRPIFVVNSDSKGSLGGAKRLGAKFEGEHVHDYALLKKTWEMLVKETGKRAGKNAIKTVVIDSFTFLARALHAELERTMDTKDGRAIYQELERRLVNTLSNYYHLDAHIITIAHAIEGSGEAGNLGVMPAVKGVSKTLIPAMCNDMLWMEVVTEKGKEPRREFLLGPEGSWTHGMRSLHGGGRMEADFGKLFAKMGLK